MKRCVIYARISVTSEESVSVERQIQSAQKYAEARGWEVVETFRDEGTSATYNKPEDRAGWRALLDSPAAYDVVIVWKVDRLARKVLDFLHADEDLQKRGAGLVAVDDPIDMSTPQGRAFAQMLAVFGEMEAAAISARVKAARAHLVKAGRSPGGAAPYGWMLVENPDGPGKVLVHDPETIRYVRQAADRTLAGEPMYATVKWLDEIGAPLPRTSQKNRKAGSGWAYTTVNRLLRNPILAGMTLRNPGDGRYDNGTEVLRGDDGLPVVDESLAVMEVAEWRRMVQLLDDRQNVSPQAKPRAMRAKTSGVLSGLVFCGDDRHDEPVRMWRGTTQGRPSYSCPECHQTLSSAEDLIVEEFLRVRGTWPRWTVVEEVYEGGARMLPEIERRLDELDGLIRDAKSRAERADLQEQQADLLDLRDAKRAESPVVTVRAEPADIFSREWERATDDETRRAVIGDALERVVVRRGAKGAWTPAAKMARLTFDWKNPDQIGPAPEDAA